MKNTKDEEHTTAEAFVEWYAKNWATATNGQIEARVNMLSPEEKSRLKACFNHVANA